MQVVHGALVEDRSRFNVSNVDGHWDHDLVLVPAGGTLLCIGGHYLVKRQIAAHPAAWAHDLLRVGDVSVGHSSSSICTRIRARGWLVACDGFHPHGFVGDTRRTASVGCSATYTPPTTLVQARARLRRFSSKAPKSEEKPGVSGKIGTVLELILAAAGLGVAGLDPAGALLAVGALSAGARNRNVVAFGLIAIFGTVVVGTVLTLTLGRELAGIELSDLLPPDWLLALLELLVAVGLVYWGIIRLNRPTARPRKPARERKTGGLALAALGALWAASAVLDPTFVALVAIGSRDASLLAIVSAQTVWILISQLPLAVMVVAVARGRHERGVAWFQRLWARVQPKAATVGTSILLLAGAAFALDSLWWLVTDEFLFPDPT
jgi:hypothetical protein